MNHAAPSALTELLLQYQPRLVILCVDDTREILTSLGAQISTYLGRSVHLELVETPEEGLEVLQYLKDKGRRPALITTDQNNSPDMLGDEFLMQAHALFPLSAKVIISAMMPPSQAVHAFHEAGLFHFISKPWEMAELVRTLRSGLTRYLTYRDMSAALTDADRVLLQAASERLRPADRQFFAGF